MTRYNKALIATAVAILITTLQAVQASYEDAVWTTEDTLVTVLAFLGAVLVYAKANTPPAGQPSDPNVSETAGAVVSEGRDPLHRQNTGDLGETNLLLVLAVVGVVLLVLLLVGVI